MAVDMGSAIAYLLLDTANFNTSLRGAQNNLVSAGAVMSSAGATLTATVTRGLVNIGKTAVTEAATFESSMSNVRATMLMTATDFNNQVGTVVLGAGDSLRTFTGNLSDFALEMASTTKFTASETAQALNYMALAGYSVQESMEMLPSVLSLAAAGNMDLARASDMVTDTQTAFGLTAQRTAQMVDEMAKAASTGNTSVEQLGDAFLTVGGLAKELNGGFVTLKDGSVKAVDGVQELEIALTAMANAGIKGSEAGTHMRNMLLKLSSPTKEGAARLESLGVSVFDAEGKMRSLKDVMGDLGTSLSNLTQEQKLQAISDLFNVRDTAAAEALLNAIGQDWDEIGEAILDAEGAAQQMADIQLDNLNGQITILKSALQVLAIQFGNLLLPAIKKFIAFVQKLTKWLSSLNDSQKKTVVRFGAIVAAIGPVLIIFGRLIALLGSTGKSFASLGKVLASFGSIGTLSIVGLVATFAKLYATNESFRNSINNTFGKLVQGVMNFAEAVKPAFEGLFEAVNIFMDEMSGPLLGVFDGIVTVFNNVLSAVKPIVNKVIGYITALVIKLTPVFKKVVDTVANLFKNIDLSGVIEALGGIIDWIANIVDAQLPLMADTFSKVFNAAVLIVQPLIDTIAKVADGIVALLNGDLQTAGERFGDAFNSASDVVKAVLNTITTLFSGLWDGIKPLVQPIIDWFSDAATSISGFFESIPGTLSSFLDSALAFVTNFSSSVANFFTVTIPGAIKSAIGSFNDLPYNIGFALGTALKFVVTNVNKIYNTLKEKIKLAVDSAISFFKTLPAKVKIELDSVLTKVGSFASDLFTKMSSAASDAISAISEWFSALPGKFKSWFDDAIAVLKSIDLASVGSNIMNSLWSGLKSKWESIKSWFNSLKLNWSKFFSGLRSGFGGGGDGSYATGLSYVPRTMNITVHRGERILTQQENEEYNKGGSVEVVTYQNDEAINKLNSTMDKLLDKVEKIKEMKVVLDTKRVVGGLVNEMDKQLGKKAQIAGGMA